MVYHAVDGNIPVCMDKQTEKTNILHACHI
jgi:hypothetical protein